MHQSESLGDDAGLDFDLRLGFGIRDVTSKLQLEVRAGWRSFEYFGNLDGFPVTFAVRYFLLEGLFRPSIYGGGGAFFGMLEQFDNQGPLGALLISAGGATDVVFETWVVGAFAGWESFFESLEGADWVMIGLRIGARF